VKLRLDKIEVVKWKGSERLVSFRGDHGNSFNVRLSPNGRLISITYGMRTLHSREQRGGGGRRFRLPSGKVKQARDAAFKAIAFRALGNPIARFPPQEFDL
jgi:hypothetical protein